MKTFALVMVLAVACPVRAEEKSGNGHGKEPQRVTATQLVESFWTNAASTDEHYLDKEVIVTGKLVWIRRDKEVQNRRDGQAFDATPEYYSMEMEIDESVRRSGLQLVMVFDLKHRKKLAELKRGESVAVAGTCKRLGRSVTIELLDCKLLFPK